MEFLSIKEIADKIVVEADIQSNEYPIANRLTDINETALYYIELANQIGSKEPIANAEVVSETFNVVVGDNTFLRTIKDVFIFRVDFQPGSTGDFCRAKEDLMRNKDTSRCFCAFENEFYADEKQVYVQDARVAGTLRVTYVRGDFTLYDTNDYNATPEVYPTWFPDVFRSLLWLKPALRQAAFYKTNREGYLKEEYAQLHNLFVNHYKRNAKYRGKIHTPNMYGNYR